MQLMVEWASHLGTDDDRHLQRWGRERRGGILNAKSKRLGVVESSSVLPECCQVELPCTLQATTLGTVGHGYLHSLGSEAIRILLQDGEPLRVHTLYAISFEYNNRCYIFLSNVRKYEFTSGRGMVEFELPDHLVAADLSGAFRVPVVPECELEVLVKTRTSEISVAACDISLSGIRVMFQEGDEIPAAGKSVELQLSFGEHELNLKGQVRNAIGNQVGFYFPSAMRGDHIDPPEELRRLVRELERNFVRFRKTTEV